jgi:uncharacterized repeat protein (TIGR03837 family)
MRWDLFCKVVDNYGDVGVAWRLAAELGARGATVRFWIDERSALAWMAPAGAPGVAVGSWGEAAAVMETGDVVAEAFGCGLPAVYAERMAARSRQPVWVNLEYLSAESFVERNHGLPSPRLHGPAAGLTQWFFYPGFTPATGGLLREAGLLERRQRFSRTAWLQALGLERPATSQVEERVVSLFCYENAALAQLLDTLATEPTLLLATAGPAARQVRTLLGPRLERGPLRAAALPLLSQAGYDHLLWAADLNFVRGEDSFVRAQWAAVPFVWQIYPQQDGAHAAKLGAFLDRHLRGAAPDVEGATRQLFTAWNGLASWPAALPAHGSWHAHCGAWRAELLAQPDLVSQLEAFVAERQ